MKETSLRFYQWAQAKAASERAPLWLGLLFMLEIFLFIPLDPLLIFFSLENRRNKWLYATLGSIASTFSACMGYVIGHFLWDIASPYVIPSLISASAFERMVNHFQVYEHGAVFLGAFLPFPLKALSLGAGVFELGLGVFAFYFLLARILRFFALAGAVALWGDRFKAFLDRHFHRLFLLIGAKVAFVFLLIWVLNLSK